MVVIGELINSSRRLVRDAIQVRDEGILLDIARQQRESGAHYVDLNCGTLGAHEATCLNWLISLIQDRLAVEVSIDSANTSTILNVLGSVKGRPVVNSVSADSPGLDEVFAAARDRQAKVIGLCLTGTTLPSTADETRASAELLLSKASECSFPLCDLFLDPLVRAVSTDPSSCRIFLNALAAVKSLSGEAKTVCGLSNISFGMPARKALNRAFLPLAVMQGLDAVILDPTDAHLMGILHASMALACGEAGVTEYLTAYRCGRILT